ncbi:cell envelope biogenesis protein TolA [Coralliovum pocilloporae]|uniref:cell envelope biogenesis protein TolA n=1 Tax=Coralliovum pocilloporae TaxID=3066369 RepID=UPI0033074DCF
MSLFGHTGILLWGLVSLPSVAPLEAPPIDVLPVELVPIEDVEKTLKGDKRGKVKEVIQKKKSDVEAKPTRKTSDKAKTVHKATPKPTPEKVAALPPKPKAALEPPKQEKVKEPEPAPTPKAEPKPVEPAPKVEETKAEPESNLPKTVSAPQRRPKPPKKVAKKKPKKKQEQFDPNDIAALLNKQDSASGGSTTGQDVASLGSAFGSETARLSQNELNALRGQIQQCWNPPAGAANPEDLIVTIRFQLTESGEVNGSPAVLQQPGGAFGQAAADSALRAIWRCGPYSNLPIEKYSAWRDVEIVFDPRNLF